MAEPGFELGSSGSSVHVLEYLLCSEVPATPAWAKGHDSYPYFQLSSEGRINTQENVWEFSQQGKQYVYPIFTKQSWATRDLAQVALPLRIFMSSWGERKINRTRDWAWEVTGRLRRREWEPVGVAPAQTRQGDKDGLLEEGRDKPGLARHGDGHGPCK